ncbi:SPFH domain-containing protein [Clostridium sp. AL.422]|uniref:SPFH domain-containing protein n=1 Tax=Clostridium TaxID=1485 RepID=UPI00293DAC2E|nr:MULTISPECIES: SPFH domain-containing protein [unclassified Clostridium]MDV4150283.1 SPFH domain-containing protein [Clostridium sp. AL.422]
MEITSIIKYEGDNSTFVWKHPKEDFNTSSQLIVHESQEAVFFLNGQPLDLFGSGCYTLETGNIPILQKIKNIPTDGISPFHCEVYFINKVEQMSIQWGTDSKIQYMEPTYGFPLDIGANGEMSLRVQDSKKLLINIVGTERYLSQSKLVNYFRAFLMTKIKTYIAQVMKNSAISIFEMDEHLIEFSDELKKRLEVDFSDYGISLERFFVASIAKPDGNQQYEKFKELHFRQYADITEAKLQQRTAVIHAETESQKTVIASKAMATKRIQEGYTYQQERGFDVAQDVAKNEAVGQFTNMGIGLGTMVGVGGAVGGVVGGAINGAFSGINQTPYEQTAPLRNSNQTFCDNCGAVLVPGIAFCEECGTPVMTKPSCTKCGYVYERPGKFCPKCGTKREV